MPAKKAARTQPQYSGMNMNTVWMWVYAAGMVIAGVLGGLGFSNDILNLLLLFASVLVGIFLFDHEEVGQFGLRGKEKDRESEVGSSGYCQRIIG